MRTQKEMLEDLFAEATGFLWNKEFRRYYSLAVKWVVLSRLVFDISNNNFNSEFPYRVYEKILDGWRTEGDQVLILTDTGKCMASISLEKWKRFLAKQDLLEMFYGSTGFAERFSMRERQGDRCQTTPVLRIVDEGVLCGSPGETEGELVGVFASDEID